MNNLQSCFSCCLQKVSSEVQHKGIPLQTWNHLTQAFIYIEQQHDMWLIPIISHVTNASNIVYFLVVNHEYHRLNVPEHDFPAILFQLHLRHLISPFNSPFPSRNSTVLIICKEIRNNLDSTPPCPTELHLNELYGI